MKRMYRINKVKKKIKKVDIIDINEDVVWGKKYKYKYSNLSDYKKYQLRKNDGELCDHIADDGKICFVETFNEAKKICIKLLNKDLLFIEYELQAKKMEIDFINNLEDRC